MQNQTIRREAIENALVVKDTWLGDALKAYRLVSRYGKGGSCESPEVVAELGKDNETPPRGCGKLYDFLRSWDTEYSSVTNKQAYFQLCYCNFSFKLSVFSCLQRLNDKFLLLLMFKVMPTNIDLILTDQKYMKWGRYEL